MRRSLPSLLSSYAPLFLVTSLLACGTTEDPGPNMIIPPGPIEKPGKPYHYPLDDVLRLDHVQVRGTHNSYHVDTHNREIDPWAYTHAPIYEQLDRLRIRQLELDVSYDETAGLEVFHVASVDTGTRCQRLADCLTEIRRFSDEFPGHLPIYIQIEPKDSFEPEVLERFFLAIETEILAAFPRPRIITPDEVQGDSQTLVAALKDHGWPVLGKLRGRVMFLFDARNTLRDGYAHGGRDLRGRLLFVDSSPDQPYGAVSILNDPKSGAAAIERALKAGFLVRTRADSDTVEARTNDTSFGEAALRTGATFISTDFPEAAPPWIYRFEVPGGTPARCNPVTAPPSCSPLALEDPAFVGTEAPNP